MGRKPGVRSTSSSDTSNAWDSEPPETISVYEHRRTRPLPRRLFVLRMAGHFAVAAILVALSLFFGMWGYERYEHLEWRDAFLNAAMLLGGMERVVDPKTDQGNVVAR